VGRREHRPGFLASFLRSRGHEASFHRFSVEQTAADVLAVIRARKPDVLGFSLTTRQWLRAKDLVATLRRDVDLPFVAGGLHPTFSPDEVLAGGFDYACKGEGELALFELVEALRDGRPTDDIANLQSKIGVPAKLRPPFEPMDDLPFLARDLLDEHPGVVHMTTQRGCPFPCTYCAARMYNQLYGEQGADYGRRRTIRNVMDELHQLRDAGRFAYAIFLDDTFTIHHPWVKEFCQAYGEELRLPFSLHARVETVNERMLHELAAAGCNQITYGVESGSERIRYDVMRRPVKNQRFIDVFRWTREAGIRLTANFMLGLPEETRDDLQMTYDLAEQLDVMDFGYFVFYPYPGTQLFHTCQEKGYLPAGYEHLPANHRASILNLPTLTNDDIGEYYDKFTALRRRLYVERLGFDPTAEAVVGAAEHVADLAKVG
jgi:anaerobic magnesium-protoporphyrin IX monomethyl ester cyclase